ncbi:MAG TPA: hypothetical protein PKN32_07760 [Bacteroidales bacterium]|nr:hypothetical protein [Bacteroidales bacterium]
MKIGITLFLILFFEYCFYAQNDTIVNVSVADISLNQKISVLNGRVFLTCPDSAFVMSRQGGNTSAQTNQDKETRIYFDIEDQRMVIFAQELYLYSVSDLFTYLEQKYAGDRNYNQLPGAVRVISEDSLHIAISATPCRFEESSSTFLINSLWVQCTDSMLIKLDVYLNSISMHSWEDYLYLTERIFSTLECGERMLNLTAREVSKNIFKTDQKLVFNLPEKHILQTEEGFDFMIFSILPVKKVNEDPNCKAIIYLGKNPVWFYNSYGFTQGENSVVNGAFLGNRMRGFYFKKPNQKKFLLEYQGEANKIGKGLKFHIILIGDSKEAIDSLKEITESVRIEN